MAAPGRKVKVDFPGWKTNWNAGRSAGIWRTRVGYGEFTSVAATTGTKDFSIFPGGLMVVGAFIWVATKFLGGAISAVTLALGSTGTADLYSTAADAFANSGVILPGKTIVPGTFIGGAAAPNELGTVRLTIVSTTANLTALTQGVADIHFILRAVPLPS